MNKKKSTFFTKADFKNYLVDKVTIEGPMTLTVLASTSVHYLNDENIILPSGLDANKMIVFVNELVSAGRLSVVNYTLKNQSYRIKTIVFPAQTEFTLNKSI